MTRTEALQLAENEISLIKDGFYRDNSSDDVYWNFMNTLIEKCCDNDLISEASEHFLIMFFTM